MATLNATQKKKEILENLLKYNTVTEMCEALGIERNQYYRYRSGDPEFKQTVDKLLAELVNEAAGRVKLELPEIISTLMSIARDRSHKDCLGAIKEANRIAEKKEGTVPKLVDFRIEL